MMVALMSTYLLILHTIVIAYSDRHGKGLLLMNRK